MSRIKQNPITGDWETKETYMRSVKSPSPKNTRGFWYCYKNENGAVFLDRQDKVIKTFDSFEDAVEYADKNIHLIDRP
jgi:hypothetical protein